MHSFPVRPGVELHQLEERHAPAVFARVDLDRAYLRRWLAWVDANQTLEDTLSFVRGAVDNFAAGRAITLGIWAEGELAGVIGTHRIDWVNRRVEIGYWLGEPFQGRGIMSAACRVLVGDLFGGRGLHRVECLCATGNARSNAIPQRLGFTREGVLREALLLQERYHDVYVWSVLAQDWER
jgi:ribosomal-protein-serine acetyltransferase